MNLIIPKRETALHLTRSQKVAIKYQNAETPTLQICISIMLVINLINHEATSDLISIARFLISIKIGLALGFNTMVCRSGFV